MTMQAHAQITDPVSSAETNVPNATAANTKVHTTTWSPWVTGSFDYLALLAFRV